MTMSSTTTDSLPSRLTVPSAHSDDRASNASTAAPSKTSSDTVVSSTDHDHVDNTAEFAGDINTNNEIPSLETLKKIQDYTVLDKDGKSLPFRNIISGPNVARRVLVIFIRHFFCGVSLLPFYTCWLQATFTLASSTQE